MAWPAEAATMAPMAAQQQQHQQHCDEAAAEAMAVEQQSSAAPILQQLADEPLPAGVPPPPPVPRAGLFGADGSIGCPLCPRYRTRGSTRGLTRHIYCAHAGRALDEGASALLCAIGRGVCPEPTCKIFRSFGGGPCYRCRTSDPPRALVVGDRVPSTAVGEIDHIAPVPHRQQLEPEVPEGALPDDFLERVRQLGAQTILHIPMAFRSRAAAIMAATLLAAIRGSEKGNMLEQARSKMLYGRIPQGFSTRKELGERFALWEQGRFAELLLRSEAQAAFRIEDHRRRKGGSVGRQRASRAKALARAGAYRRAVVSLTSEVADLSDVDQRQWAAQLLPCSSRPVEALAGAAYSSDDEVAGEVAAGSALHGVRFGALSAAGPTGARPEHVRDAMTCKPRAASTQLARAISLLHQTAMAGQLSDQTRWLLDSRLVFLKKKVGLAPRPVRVGELWRRIVAKKAAHGVRDGMKASLLNHRQFGVAVGGGADVLVHFRTAVEEAARRDDGPALLLLDLDLQNAFPTFEWAAIREAVGDMAPSLSAWTSWCHQAPAEVLLPSGERKTVDRGAEQGDPLGSLYCGVTLAMAVAKARARLADCAELDSPKVFFDVWYMDDGQVLLDPATGHAFLEILDDELAKVGATRGSGDGVKSVARLIGSGAACREAGDAWVTDRIRATCKLPGANAPSEGILGIDIKQGDAQFQAACGQVAATREAIASLGDAATELVLTRSCADVCKVTHLLRAHGVDISDAAASGFDDGLASALQTTLAAPLHAEALSQASMGVKDGGLGVRMVSHTLAPAALASRVRARPLVLHLFQQMRDLELAPDGLDVVFDAPAQAAEERLRSSLSPAGVARLDLLLQEARTAADVETRALLAGRPPPRAGGHVPHEDPGTHLVQQAGGEDPEWHCERGGLQHDLCALADCERADRLVATLQGQGRWSDVRRLRCLRDPSTSHAWLWGLNPVHGPIVPPADFGLAACIRIGAHLVEDAFVCPRCSKEVVGRTAAHALCCAAPQATHGHYDARDQLLLAVHLADPSATPEAPEIIASHPALRPADIFTSAAIPGGLAALDVGITSPDAAGAGDDCVESMWQKKRNTYAPYFDEMRAARVTYVPMVLSCYGRWHPESAVTLERVCRQAARRLGIADHRPLLSRAHAAAGVAIWRRAVAMARACLPRLAPADCDALLSGET